MLIIHQINLVKCTLRNFQEREINLQFMKQSEIKLMIYPVDAYNSWINFTKSRSYLIVIPFPL